jgi:hypothetical protein
MTYLVKGAHDKLTKRLNKAIKTLERGGRPRYGSDDLGVFCYIREQITPESIKATRREDDTNIPKLHAVANERLAYYEKEADHG